MALACLDRRLFAPRGGRYTLDLVVGRRRVHVLRGGAQAIVARISEVSIAGEAQVAIEIAAAAPLEDALLEDAFVRARGLCGLDDDPTGFAELAARDPRIAGLQRRFAGARLARTATVFEAFATAVVGQLVTWQEAKASLTRLRGRYGAMVPGDPDLVAFPTSEVVATLPPHELRAIGIGLRRAATLIAGARRGAALEALRDATADPSGVGAIERLEAALRGVGPWTATTIALDAFGWPDAVPPGDATMPWLVTKALTGVAGDDGPFFEALEPFRPHRARVVQLLVLAGLFRGAVAGVPRRRRPVIDPHRRRPWRA
jgi:3-methyladenine DNA glycosylase/8-oxoguanine DNA glycosylase